MVQIQPPKPEYCAGRDYWKLSRHDGCSHDSLRKRLSSDGYVLPEMSEKLTSTFITLLMWRKERGLLNYHSLETSELKQFVRNRGLERKITQPYRAYVINALQRDDDNATFSRFSDLPEELRLKIYSHHYASLRPCGVSEFILPPPITEVSKQIREESLPEFYKNITWTMSFKLQRTRPGIRLLRHSRNSIRFFGLAPASQIAMIKKVVIKSPCTVTHQNRRVGVYGQWELDIGAGKRPPRTTLHQWYYDEEGGKDRYSAPTLALQSYIFTLVASRPKRQLIRIDGQRFLDCLNLIHIMAYIDTRPPRLRCDYVTRVSRVCMFSPDVLWKLEHIHRMECVVKAHLECAGEAAFIRTRERWLEGKVCGPQCMVPRKKRDIEDRKAVSTSWVEALAESFDDIVF